MLQVIGLDNKETWMSIVERFQWHNVYYYPEYTKAFQLHGDGEPLLFYYEDDQIRAVNVAMKRDLAQVPRFAGSITENTLFDLSTPYGYGGYLIEGEVTPAALASLDREYTDYCKNHAVVSEFVRFYPPARNHLDNASLYQVTELGKTVGIEPSTPEEMWNNLHRKCRNRVRKAQKSNVTIHWGRDKYLYDRFRDMYSVTMAKAGAGDYYYFQEDFFESIRNDLAEHALIFYAKHENDIIAMTIILLSNGQMQYHLSTSNPDYNQYSPKNLLDWETALWGQKNGYKVLHLGGGIGGSSEDSLYAYKKSFNMPSDYSFAVGGKIFDLEKYDFLLNLRNRTQEEPPREHFFPKYRA